MPREDYPLRLRDVRLRGIDAIGREALHPLKYSREAAIRWLIARIPDTSEVQIEAADKMYHANLEYYQVVEEDIIRRWNGQCKGSRPIMSQREL